MHLFVVRHGQAGPAASDDLRGLTGPGRRQLRAAAALLVERGLLPDRVITSPLVRAVQTAEILASAVGVDDELSARPEIAFPSRLEQIIEVVDEADASTTGVMVVGHEPTMGLLATQLLGDAGPRISFRTGTILALQLDRSTRRARPLFMIAGQPPAVIDL